MKKATLKERRRIWDAKYYKKHKKKIKEYYKLIARGKRKINLELLANYKENKKCLDCGEDNPILFEFDHIKGEKRHCIGDMVGTHSFVSILKEISKCELVCCNCHRIRTHKRRWSGIGKINQHK